MAYVVKIDFQDYHGWHDISSMIPPNKYHLPVVRQRKIHDNQRMTINSLKFKIGPTAADYGTFAVLHQNILAQPTGLDIKIWIQKDGVDYFTGILRPTHKAEIGTTKIKEMSIECVDISYYLQFRQTASPVAFFNYKVSDPSNKSHSILHQLMYLAGYQDNQLVLPSVTTVLPVFKKDFQVKFSDIISTLCFEYCFVLNVDESGVFQYKFLNPSSITPITTLATGSNIVGTYIATKNENSFDAVDVKYPTVQVFTQTTIWQDTTGATGSLACSIPLGPATYYPTGSNASQDSITKYTMSGYDILACTNISSLIWQHTADVTMYDSWNPGPTEFPIRLYSNNGGVITQLKVVGDAYCKPQDNSGGYTQVSQENVVNTAKRESITLDDVMDATSANAFAKCRATWYAQGVWRYEIKTNVMTLNPGDYVTLSENIAGLSQICRVLTVSDGDIGEYNTIVIEGYTPVTLTPPTAVALHAYTPAPYSPSDVGAISNIVNEVSPITNVVTYSQYLDGFTDPASHTTQTPAKPYFIVAAAAGTRSVRLIWDKQGYIPSGQPHGPQDALTNLDHYELQVSSNGTDWFQPLNDGTTMSNVGDSVEDIVLETYVHCNIPAQISGNAASGTTLHYRVRQITTLTTPSSWSDPVVVTTNVVDNGDIAANAIYANNVDTSTLNALIAKITDYIVIKNDGLQGTSQPSDLPASEGDSRVVINSNSLKVEYFHLGHWIVVTEAGGNWNNNYFRFFQALGYIKTGATAEAMALDTGIRAPYGSIVFGFERNDPNTGILIGSLLDKDGTSWWNDTSSYTYDTKIVQRGNFSVSALRRGAWQGCGFSGLTLLTNTGLQANTTYKFYVTVDGGTKQELIITMGSDTTFQSLINLLNSQVVGARFSLFLPTSAGSNLIAGDLYCISNNTSSTSSILLSNS